MELTENRRFGRKNDVNTIFVSVDIISDFIISSRTEVVAVAVSAISGTSDFKKLNLLAQKLSLKTHKFLKSIDATLLRNIIEL